MGNQEVQRINLEKMVSQALHRPRIDGVPVYRRTDGTTDFNTSKTAKWDKRTERLNNSPSNIRKVYITSGGVLVEYWCSLPETHNSSNFSSLLTTVQEPLKRWINGDQSVRLQGNPLKALVSPWVCSNLESLYISPEMLYSEAVYNILNCNLANTVYSLQATNYPVDPLVALFKHTCSLNGDTKKRFPKLRTLGVLPPFIDLRQKKDYKTLTQGDESVKNSVRELIHGIDNSGISDSMQLIIMRNPAFIANHKSFFNIKDPSTLTAPLSIKAGIYVFDDATLLPKSQKFIEEVNRALQAGKSGDTANRKLTIEERIYNAIELEFGRDVANYSLVGSCHFVPKSELVKWVEQVTDANKEKISAILNSTSSRQYTVKADVISKNLATSLMLYKNKEDLTKRVVYNLKILQGIESGTLSSSIMENTLNMNLLGISLHPVVLNYVKYTCGNSGEFVALYNEYLDKPIKYSKQYIEKGLTRADIDTLKGNNIFISEEQVQFDDDAVMLDEDIGLGEGDTEFDNIDLEEYDENDLDETDEPVEVDQTKQLSEVDTEDETELDFGNDDDEKEDDDGLGGEILSYVNRVKQIQTDLFEVCFELKRPYGVITKQGLLRLKGKGKIDHQVSASSFSELYKVINESVNNYLVQSEINTERKLEKMRELTYREGTTYYPEYQLGTSLGLVNTTQCKSWKEMLDTSQSSIGKVIAHHIQNGRNVESIVSAVCTGLVIQDYIPGVVLKIRYSVGNGLANSNDFLKAFERNKQKIFSGSCSLYHIEQKSNTNVVEVIFVMDKAKYVASPLFAYQAVEALAKKKEMPTIKNVILGKFVNDKIFTANMGSQSSALTIIGAGQRAGKGVLTLNILGAMIASNDPVIYFDCKPDMAKMLMDLGAKYNIDVAAYDGHTTLRPNIRYGNGAPLEILKTSESLFGPLSYLKGLQLMLATVMMKTEHRKIGNSNSRPYFIFDEVMALQMELKAAWKNVEHFTKMKAKKGETLPDEAVYMQALSVWLLSLDNTLGSAIVSQLPKSGICTLWICQSVQPTAWKSYEIDTPNGKINPFIKTMMSPTCVKILGRGTDNSEYGLSNIKDNSIKTKVNGERHFAYAAQSKISSEQDIKLFKPYLVLNTAEPDADCVNELRSSVGEQVWRGLVDEAGNLDERAGFEGYCSMIGNGVTTLSQGSIFMQELFNELGLASRGYNNINEYMFDASIESFMSLSELMHLKDGNNVANGDVVINDELAETQVEQWQQQPRQTQQSKQQQQQQQVPAQNKKTQQVNQMIDPEQGEIDSLLDTYKTAKQTGELDFIDDEDIEEENLEPDGDTDDIDNVEESNSNYDSYFTDIKFKPTISQEVVKSSTMYGRSGRFTRLESSDYTQVKQLTPENSIDCRWAAKGPTKWFENILKETPMGIANYTDSIWRNIMTCITNSGHNRAAITRVRFFSGQLFVNNKLVILDGVIGGYDNIRLSDIVSFKILLKHFPNISELALDPATTRAAITELGQFPEPLFIYGKKLSLIILTKEDGTKEKIDRLVNNAAMQGYVNSNKMMNECDLIGRASKQERLRNEPLGDRIWGYKLAKSSMSAAAKQLTKRKKNVFKTVGYGAFGLTIGALGGATWLAVSGIRSLTRLFSGFSR